MCNDTILLDATLRDGGLVNNFRFSADFVKDLYQMNQLAGIDYMEFGYRTDEKLFDKDRFGRWKNCSDEDIYDAIGDKKLKGPKISVMLDAGRCDYKKSIEEKKNSPVDLIRVATYIDTVEEAVKIIEYAHSLGYETSCNIMAVSKCSKEKIRKALQIIGKSPIKYLYIVDSYGALYPENINALCEIYQETAAKSGALVGIHTHNNQQCAFVNTVQAFHNGVTVLDATVMGMGRGAGNCSLEQLVGYLKNPKYKIEPILWFIDGYMQKLKEEGTVWGYNTGYLLSGLLNQHPRVAMDTSKDKEHSYLALYEELKGME